MGVALYDRVTNRKCGPIWTGVVKGLAEGKFYAEVVLRHSISAYTVWNTSYPGWESELVAIVQLDKPAKCVTQEEALKLGINWAELPYSSTVFAPCADLVPMGEVGFGVGQ